MLLHYKQKSPGLRSFLSRLSWEDSNLSRLSRNRDKCSVFKKKIGVLFKEPFQVFSVLSFKLDLSF